MFYLKKPTLLRGQNLKYAFPMISFLWRNLLPGQYLPSQLLDLLSPNTKKWSFGTFIFWNAPHLLKKDVDVDDFAMLALDFKDNEYIPENNDFIVHTKMLGGGESDTINFTIEEPGDYTYVCTFPGHYQIMQGILTIE